MRLIFLAGLEGQHIASQSALLRPPKATLSVPGSHLSAKNMSQACFLNAETFVSVESFQFNAKK